MSLVDKIDAFIFDAIFSIRMYVYFFGAFLYWIAHGGFIGLRCHYWWKVMKPDGSILTQKEYAVEYPCLLGDTDEDS